jgi:hypothetical protein
VIVVLPYFEYQKSYLLLKYFWNSGKFAFRKSSEFLQVESHSFATILCIQAVLVFLENAKTMSMTSPPLTLFSSLSLMARFYVSDFSWPLHLVYMSLVFVIECNSSRI